MTHEEIIDFISQIKHDYPKFEFSEGSEYQVWKDALERISFETAEAKYEAHRNSSEYSKYPPNLKLFLFEKKQEIINEKMLEQCSWCGKHFYHNAMNKHESRHRSVDYIKSRMKKYFSRELTKQEEIELMQMNDVEFDKKYDSFLEKLIPVTSGLEHRNLLNIKYTRENPGTRLNMNLNELGGVTNDRRM